MKMLASLLLLTAALATPAQAEDLVWVAGHWTVVGCERVWVPGCYVDTCATEVACAPAPCAPEPEWVPGRWVRGCHGWTYEQGHWVQPAVVCPPPVVVCAPEPVCAPAVVVHRPRRVVCAPEPVCRPRTSVSISIGAGFGHGHGHGHGRPRHAAPVHVARPPLPHEVIANAPHHRAMRKLFGKD
ncbi:MAG TPA: hypothetical protein VEL07_09035 [Planctomycetota bacterium]|nr:hypothetical protein [Planctomycetota bacterium]